MPDPLRIAMAQLNLWVGDVAGNVDKILAAAATARDFLTADLVVFPEMAMLGYPPDDLLLRLGLPDVIKAGLMRLCDEVHGITLVVGYPEYVDGVIFNAAVVIRDGQCLGNYRKQRLPSYGVFDEHRHYQAGREACVVEVAGIQVGVTICEDIWATGPAAQAKAAGAQILVNLNASPFHRSKAAERHAVLALRARENSIGVVYVNCVGGQDELVFDGGSLAYGADGGLRVRAPYFESGVFLVVVDGVGQPEIGECASATSEDANVYAALVQATRDYVQRNGFPGVLVGASGGIDSALALAIAADALGGDKVWAVAMPSRYTADISNADAAAQAKAQGSRYDEIAIDPLFSGYLDVLAGLFSGQPVDTTEENLQARIRGTLLMALSNKFGHLVLATGNKSEMAVGYSTLYGDMCGGFAPLKDVYKTWVYRLARYRNTLGAVIPERVIERPPSAELRADQADSDSLPPYDQLDAIIEAYVEDGRTISDICATGYRQADVQQVASLIRRAEYKRRQAAPGPKITRRAFGRDRRYPISAVYGDL